MFRKTTLFMALAGLASTVSAQVPGDILFATNDRAGGSDTIQLLDYGSLTSSTLVSFAPAPLSQHRLIGGIARDAGGAFYFTNSPSPEQNPSTAAVYQVTDMFNPGLRTVNNFFSSDPVQSIEGMAYDAVTNNVLLANNPASAPVLPLRMEGILGIDVANPVAATVIIAEDPFTDPRPRPNSFNTIVGDRLRAGNFYVGSVNGGVEDDPTLPAGQDREASMISRLVMNNPSDPTRAGAQ